MATVRETATLRVSEPVSGKRRYRRTLPTTPDVVAEWGTDDVDPQVLDTAMRIMRPGQRLVRVSATEVRIVNK